MVEAHLSSSICDWAFDVGVGRVEVWGGDLREQPTITTQDVHLMLLSPQLAPFYCFISPSNLTLQQFG